MKPETSDAHLLFQLRSKPLIHQTHFDRKYIQDILFFNLA